MCLLQIQAPCRYIGGCTWGVYEVDSVFNPGLGSQKTQKIAWALAMCPLIGLGLAHWSCSLEVPYSLQTFTEDCWCQALAGQLIL